jgi:hypothetical protein
VDLLAGLNREKVCPHPGLPFMGERHREHYLRLESDSMVTLDTRALLRECRYLIRAEE